MVCPLALVNSRYIPIGIIESMDGASVDNRSHLLDCALQLFVSYGYDGTGVQQIVEAARLTKPTLYHYFGSKQGVLEALLHERLEDLPRDLRRAAVYEHDLSRALSQCAAVAFAFAREHPDLYRLQLSLWFAPVHSVAYKTVVRFHERQFKVIERLFFQAAHDHGNMRGRHRTYAATFLGSLNNYVALALNGYTELGESLVQQAVHQFMHGIFS